jgi:hypothetical protein
MSVLVLQHSAVKIYRFRIADHPRVLQASMIFEAYGIAPLRGLRFRFYEPEGKILHEIDSAKGLVLEDNLFSRNRNSPLMLQVEYMIRILLRRNIFFVIELPLSCLQYPQLAVNVENIGDVPIAAGNFRLSTSTLAPDRPELNLHAIEGYADRISVFPGERLQLFVHAPRLHFALTVLRHGAHEQPVLHIGAIAGKPQHYAANAYEEGADWEPTWTLEVGADWRSGMYTARIADDSGATFDITFIVKAAGTGTRADVAVLASTNTWLAYNPWGGASLYRYDVDDGLARQSAFRVHMHRPNPAASLGGDDGHLANAEMHILRWLERNGIAYDLYADLDLHDTPDLLRQYSTLLISTHSEYWTATMYGGLERFLAAGGNLIYLSGNGLYWKTEIRGHQLEVKYDGSRHTFSGEVGGRWRDCGRPEPQTLGIRFTKAGYKSTAPYEVLAPDHWIFDGTGVEKGTLIGRSGLNLGGASGWEMDKIDARSRPAGLVHLAKGTNRWRSGADMTYFTHPGGGGVFSVGSITFGGSLAIDPVLGRMLRNVFARFARPR